MKWSQIMKNAADKNQQLLNTAKAEDRALTDDEQKLFDENQKQFMNAKQQIENEKQIENYKSLGSTVVNDGEKPPVGGGEDGGTPKPERVYNSFTEYLRDVKNASSGNYSEKLMKLQNQAKGMNEGVGSDGGFAVQTDFAGMMLESAVKSSPLLQRVSTYNVSGNANRVSWVDIDETDVSDDSVCGGVKAYWAAEAAEVEASKPKLKEKELKLEKLMGLCYVTYELDSDSNFIEQLLRDCFTKAINRALASAVISGDGAGKPVGILTSGGVVEVSKESGQAADTVVWENITEMYHTAINPDNGNYVWLVHPDAHKQFDSFKVEVGTGGVPVYQPASMTGSVPLLRGIPVIATDHCSKLGDAGDIILADLSDYIMPLKDAIQQDMSMHVEFLSAQNAYRFILRVNGRPKTTSSFKIKNSDIPRGRYITVENRA